MRVLCTRLKKTDGYKSEVKHDSVRCQTLKWHKVSKNTWCRSSVRGGSATLWRTEKFLVLMVKIDGILEITLTFYIKNLMTLKKKKKQMKFQLWFYFKKRKYLEYIYLKRANKFVQKGMLVLTNCFCFPSGKASLVLDFDSRVCLIGSDRKILHKWVNSTFSCSKWRKTEK